MTGYNTVFLSLVSMYFYQILTAFNKLKIMSDVAHDNWKQLKLYLYIIQDQYRNKIDNIRTLSANTKFCVQALETGREPGKYIVHIYSLFVCTKDVTFSMSEVE